ncbi:MAG: ABC transporter ATP-binding protein [Candidatus Micrarchaeia archaeon]
MVEKLTKKFGDFTAVEDISFTVNDGEVFGIVGPNGAGKSTIVKMLSTILEPTSGSATINGLDIRRDAQKIRSIIGYLPEEPRTYDYMTGYEFLELFAEMYGVEKTRIPELMEFVGLDEHMDRKVGDYSKGLRQRLSVARALINDPSILIFDEPTMGLDPASARELRDKVLEMRKQGKTIVMCTHYMDEADFLCDRLAILNHGRIAAVGKPEVLKQSLSPKRILSVVVESKEREFADALGAKTLGRNILIERDDLGSAMVEAENTARSLNTRILSAKSIEPTLDDVFIAVTKEKLEER